MMCTDKSFIMNATIISHPMKNKNCMYLISLNLKSFHDAYIGLIRIWPNSIYCNVRIFLCMHVNVDISTTLSEHLRTTGWYTGRNHQPLLRRDIEKDEGDIIGVLGVKLSSCIDVHKTLSFLSLLELNVG